MSNGWPEVSLHSVTSRNQYPQNTCWLCARNSEMDDIIIIAIYSWRWITSILIQGRIALWTWSRRSFSHWWWASGWTGLVPWLFRSPMLPIRIAWGIWRQKHVRNRHGCFSVAFSPNRENHSRLSHSDQLASSTLHASECSMAHCKLTRLLELMGLKPYRTFRGWRKKYPNDSKCRRCKFRRANFPRKCTGLWWLS